MQRIYYYVVFQGQMLLLKMIVFFCLSLC